MSDYSKALDSEAIGAEMYRLIEELYPICRSITGNGVRESLRLLQQHIQMEIHEVPTGTKAFDWVVPKEWNIRDAYVRNDRGEKVIDFQRSNLHVVNYSIPVHRTMPLTELKEHLFSIPEKPDWIPYRTSYYKESWGFCLSHNNLQRLEDDNYEVYIDSSLEPGHMSYGDYYLGGKTEEEVLISSHICHPSLCNDNLSGMVLATFVAKHLSRFSLRYSYRFLFVPGTIGSITWLQLNDTGVPNIRHGLVVACVGDRGKLNYKKSRRGDSEIDRAAVHVLKHSGQDYEVSNFSPYGYDERQYCSPGFNLPVGSLTRTPHGRYAEYHTSADNLELVEPRYLADSLKQYLAIIEILEYNHKYENTNPKCEPQLGKRGLYNAFGGRKEIDLLENAVLWTLNLSDGDHALLDIAEESGLEFCVVKTAANLLLSHNLLVRASE